VALGLGPLPHHPTADEADRVSTEPINLRKSLLPGLTSPQAPEAGEGTPQAPSALQQASPASLAAAGTDAPAWSPTEAQVRVKARFWRAWADQPLLSAKGAPTLATIQAVTGSAALKGWWAKEGFQEWFLNSRVGDDRIEYLMHLALSAAEDILLNDDPKAQGARVQMIKTVAELAGRTGARQAAATEKGAAGARQAAIGSMSKDELVQLLEAGGIKVERVVSVDVPTPSAKEPS